MILNENYNGKTPLKNWWKIVRDNFRTIAANAVSKKELSDSVSEAITQYVSEDMEALEDVRQALQDNADVVEVLNSSITAINNHKADKANPHEVTKEQVGLGNVLNVKQASKEEFDALAAAKSEVVFGTYDYGASDDALTKATLDTAARTATIFINLGFRPKAVEVYSARGELVQFVFGADACYRTHGGMAVDGYPMIGSYGTKGLKSTVNTEANWARQVVVNHIEIADGGFYVRDAISANNTETWHLATYSYMLNGTHYFKAYKYGSVVNATEEAGE